MNSGPRHLTNYKLASKYKNNIFLPFFALSLATCKDLGFKLDKEIKHTPLSYRYEPYWFCGRRKAGEEEYNELDVIKYFTFIGWKACWFCSVLHSECLVTYWKRHLPVPKFCSQDGAAQCVTGAGLLCMGVEYLYWSKTALQSSSNSTDRKSTGIDRCKPCLLSVTLRGWMVAWNTLFIIQKWLVWKELVSLDG